MITAMKDYLGVGAKYPVQTVNGKMRITEKETLVEQSIFIILSTPVGSRFMLPEFGSRVEELIFEQNDILLQNMLRLYIAQALENWEKRIKFVGVNFSIEEETILCTINYKLLYGNEIQSYIYPFYRQLKW